MEHCVFCAIVAGKAPASVVYEGDQVMAFMDIRPVNPGHTLVIPKEHYIGLQDLDEEIGAHLFRITKRAAHAVRESGVRCEGINLFLADGEAAFQEVMHVHMHVLPRFVGDPFRIRADWSQSTERLELDRTGEMIRGSYQRLWAL